MTKMLLAGIALFLIYSNAMAQRLVLIEDAEQGDILNWRVGDKTPDGYRIENRAEDGNRFISLRGTAQQNSFLTGSINATNSKALGISNLSAVSWRMRTDVPFSLSFAMDTTEGLRYVLYSHTRLSEPSGSDKRVRVGLGSLAQDGQWHQFNRNLQADLQQAQPGNSILSINAVIVRGSADIDDIVFYESAAQPVAPELTTPVVQATIEGGTAQTFSWLKSDSSSDYQLQIFRVNSPDPVAVSAFVSDSACATSTCSVSIELDMPAANDYQWHVIATNAGGSSVSEHRNFVITPTASGVPETPVNITPAIAANLLAGTNVEFVWQHDPNVFIYEFHIFDNVAKNTTPYVSGLLANEICESGTCSLVHRVDQPVSTYHAWRVRGRNIHGVSAWSRSIFSVVKPAVDPANNPPQASFVIEGFEENASGIMPFTVSLNPSLSSDDTAIVSYAWNFGDGSASIVLANPVVVEHTYYEPGEYTLVLAVSDAQGLTSTFQRVVFVDDSQTADSSVEASRLLAQATFGPTLADIRDVQRMGIDNWLERQFLLQSDSHQAYVQAYSNGSGRSPRHEIWWKNAIEGEDQLRQRVAFALSQLFVVSDSGYTLSNAQYGVTAYYQMLLDNAFGNYRELLEKVTLHPVMGIYLSMLQNGKGNMQGTTRPDENYAREVLQLFSIGLHNLHIDGSTDGSPVFTQKQIEAFARTFTGWNYADAGRWDRPFFTGADMISPMEPFEEHHDTDEKILLNGEVLPAGLSAREDLERALDNIFNHPNVAPFVVKQLIKRLVTSNPSRQYVADIARVFNDDGSGTRGNMKAVIKALLLHDEARNVPTGSAYGKLREPVLRLSHLWRAFGITPGSQSDPVRNEFNTASPQLMNLELDTGQAPLKSPSVFNFFQPNYSPAGIADTGLVAPEFELFTEGNELTTSNRIGRQIQQYSVASKTDSGQAASFLDFTYEFSLAADVDALLDHLDLVLMSGAMRPALRDLLYSHLSALSDSPSGLLARVRDAVTLIMASPDYLVQM